MKKFFAILLGIVDVFCVGLIFYLMLSNLSGTPAQIFLPILPPTLVAFLAAALIGRPDRAGIFRRTQEESPELPPPQRLIPL